MKANSKNINLQVKRDLNNCCYEPKMKDYLYNIIMKILNYPKQFTKALHSIKTMNQKKILMVLYPMNILFNGKAQKVPIEIYIMPQIPLEPPLFFLKIEKGSEVNINNKDIDPTTNKIMINSLKNWNQNSNIEIIMKDIYMSFSKTFPICKKKLSNNKYVSTPKIKTTSGNGKKTKKINNIIEKPKNVSESQDYGLFGKIKSTYILKTLLSLIEEKHKLKLLKYNKYLQNKCDISIMNYKFCSGKYKKLTKEGIVKIYDGESDQMIFEGEYKNGNINGKVKEYYLNGNIKFEGEYLNGKRNGKGKEYDYWDGGEVIFEGEYSNGKVWNGKGYQQNYQKKEIISEINNGKGYIKEFDNYNTFNRILLSEHEYINGERNGKAKEYYDKDKIQFEGEYLDDKRKKGKEYNTDGKIIFEGEYLNGKKWNGIFFNPNECELKEGKGNIKTDEFEGEYLNGERNGKGKELYDGQIKFEGEYINGERNGKGKEYWNNQLLFEGEYLYGHKKKGKEYYDNGKLLYEGEYLFDKKWDGKGYDPKGKLVFTLKKGKGKIKEYNSSGSIQFVGEYLDGKRTGKGKEYDFLGKIEFDGEYLNGQRKKGTEYENGYHLRFKGEYSNGQRKKGTEYGHYDSDGNKQLVKYKGEYLYGKKHGKGKDYSDYNGQLQFEGEYVLGNRTGNAKEYNCNGGIEFEGEYFNDKRKKGKEYDYDGNLIFEGEYIDYDTKRGKKYNKKGKVIFDGEFKDKE